ncbi:hypothetical protein RRG08_045586 [Elysia crispata]|uniref:Uncharacterized protein n=1 Tax=Elysia crispata TaxID=231223 RepID=A0AAE1ACK8_9GAST|nr:hypothetical protein RRG08_045586 [Elysia crispata]
MLSTCSSCHLTKLAADSVCPPVKLKPRAPYTTTTAITAIPSIAEISLVFSEKIRSAKGKTALLEPQCLDLERVILQRERTSSTASCTHLAKSTFTRYR